MVTSTEQETVQKWVIRKRVVEMEKTAPVQRRDSHPLSTLWNDTEE